MNFDRPIEEDGDDESDAVEIPGSENAPNDGQDGENNSADCNHIGAFLRWKNLTKFR
jgi:hypothetical protein